MRGFPAAMVLSLALVASACGGGTDGEDADAAVPTPVIGGVADPTPTPAPVAPTSVVAAQQDEPPDEDPTEIPAATASPMSEADLLDLVGDAYLADPAPEGTIAVDILERELRPDELIELTVCTWDGATAFDEVRQVLLSQLGEVLSTAPTAGTCLNTGVVDSALSMVEEYLVAFHRIQTDPLSITEQNADLRRLTTDELFDGQVELVNEWIGAQVAWRETQYRPGLLADIEGEVLWRRYRSDEGIELGLAVCRPMVDSYGLYRGDALVDDEKPDDPGEWAAIEFRMRRTEDGAAWEMVRTDSRVWAHCFRSGDWPAAVNEWKPDPALWQVVP